MRLASAKSNKMKPGSIKHVTGIASLTYSNSIPPGIINLGPTYLGITELIGYWTLNNYY